MPLDLILAPAELYMRREPSYTLLWKSLFLDLSKLYVPLMKSQLVSACHYHLVDVQQGLSAASC